MVPATAAGVGSCLGATTTLNTASPNCFVKHQIMFTNSLADLALYKVAFSELHAVQLVDMDGDGLPDIVTGKDWLACPYSCDDPDSQGTPVVYVFKLVRDANPPEAGKAHFEPHLVNAAVPASGTGDDAGAFPAAWTGGSGVGRQLPSWGSSSTSVSSSNAPSCREQREPADSGSQKLTRRNPLDLERFVSVVVVNVPDALGRDLLRCVREGREAIECGHAPLVRRQPSVGHANSRVDCLG